MKKTQKSNREKYLVRTYGITTAQYNQLLKKQGGVCAVCSKPPKPGKNLAVDHNHQTGEVRGLLDFLCNHRVIGRHTDPELLQRASDYLRQGTGWFIPSKKRKRKYRKR